MFGEVIGAALGWAGDKPELPPYVPIDLQAQQKKAIAGNLAAMPEALKVGDAMTGQRLKDIERLMPGTAALKEKTLANINQLLSGELPADVMDFLERKGAERAVASGTVGSTFAGNRTLRDLGLTSLGMAEKGLAAAERWLAQANATPTFDVSSMFISPAMQAQFAIGEREFQFGHQWLGNQLEAMPSPLENAMMSSLRKWDDLTWQVAGTAAGGALGGKM